MGYKVTSPKLEQCVCMCVCPGMHVHTRGDTCRISRTRLLNDTICLNFICRCYCYHFEFYLCVGRSEDNFWDLVLFYCKDPGDWTQDIGLGVKCPLIHSSVLLTVMLVSDFMVRVL